MRCLLAVGGFLPPRLVSACFGTAMRIVGPRLSRHEVGRQNLAAAFPEKSYEEREKILAGMWTNLGRVGAEFIFLERWSRGLLGKSSVVEFDDATENRLLKLRDDNMGALLFAAHVGNWELPAVVAKASGLQTMVLYRPPNNRSVAYVIREIRSRTMGEMVPAGMHAIFALAKGLREGKHIGILVDQHDKRGVPVTFFGRTCLTNPLIAMLAREYDLPIHGTYIRRLDKCRFKIELTPRIVPVRNSDKQVDLAATMQLITSEIESWIRQAPEQWLWVHRRWRDLGGLVTKLHDHERKIMD